MSTWALLVMVLLVLLAVGIVLLASRRGRTPVAAAPAPAPGRTVEDLVRSRQQSVEEAAEPVEEPSAAVEAEPAEAPASAAAEPAESAESAESAEPTAPTAPTSPTSERRVDPDVDAGPVGPPWTRGFVDGVPVEGPPRPKPARRTTVDPALVARVTSVVPPARSQEERPVERGIVSPAVADAIARARGQGERPPLAAVPDLPEAPRPSRFVASGATVAGLALAGYAAAKPAEHPTEPTPTDPESQATTPESDTSARESDTTAVESNTEARESDTTAVEPGTTAAESDAAVGEADTSAAHAGVGAGEAAGREAPEAAVAESPVDAEIEAAGGAPLAPLPSPRDGAQAEPRPVLAVVPGSAERRLRAVPAFATSSDPRSESVIDTPVAGAGARPVTLSAVTPSPAAPRSTSPAGTASSEDPRAAEHAAVDLALLRTLGFADPNPRNGVSPVVDMSVEHPDETPEPPGQPTPVAFRVHGRDHAAVADAAVALLDTRGREAASATGDDQGRGTVTAPRPGGYVLVASAAGHQPGVVAIRAEVGGGTVEVPLVRSSAITGRVRDGEGAPVIDAVLDLLQDGELVGSATTAADGGYRFAELAAGDYTVAVQKGGRAPVVVAVRVDEEVDREQDVVLPAGVAAPHPG
ncbi:carboxypeptidase regulatory-like domain-containing protein [Pseudonocardia xishanensis]|uniref:Alpha-amylase n=1 Tax=Pseudonocardia xishanensis TaxID=630995 RepID=A0ABP8RVG4_9PSEU